MLKFICVNFTRSFTGHINAFSHPRLHLLCALLASVGFCRKAHAQAPLLIPFEYENDFIIVRATVNQGFPVELLFDTGSEYTLITEPSLFGLLNQNQVEPVRLVGSDMASAVTGVLSRRNRLRVGDLDIAGQPIIAVASEFLDLTQMVGRDVYGIMGIGAFGAYVLEINYARRFISLTPPAQFKPTRKALAVPLVTKSNKPYVYLDTQVHPEYRDSLLYLVDSGAALEAMIYAKATESTLYPPQVIAGSIGHGLGGSLIGFVGRTDSMHLSGLTLTGVVTHFQVAGDSLLRDSIATRNGVIGNRLLSRFDVAIDFPSHTLYLTPRRKARRPLSYDRSGLKVVDDATSFGAARVQFVSPGTPASEAGVLAGDLIRKVNGWPVRLLTTEDLQRRLRAKVGRRITLSLDRDGRSVRCTFTLRELI